MVRKAFHVFLALLIAAPLGAGGLCCCLLGAGEAVAMAATDPPTGSSCCEQEPASPPPPSSHCPDETEDDACKCATRDIGLTVAVGSVSTAVTAPPLALVSPALNDSEMVACESAAVAVAIQVPPQKTPLFRIHCVLRS